MSTPSGDGPGDALLRTRFFHLTRACGACQMREQSIRARSRITGRCTSGKFGFSEKATPAGCRGARRTRRFEPPFDVAVDRRSAPPTAEVRSVRLNQDLKPPAAARRPCDHTKEFRDDSQMAERISERRPRERRRADGRSGGRRGRAWVPEGLEERVLLTGLTYTVDQTTDTGAGSGTSGDLRYAITQANANPGSTIQFARLGHDRARVCAAGRDRRHDNRRPGCVEPHGPEATRIRVLTINGASRWRSPA